MSYKRYWVALAIVILGSFAVLGGVGRNNPVADVMHGVGAEAV